MKVKTELFNSQNHCVLTMWTEAVSVARALDNARMKLLVRMDNMQDHELKDWKKITVNIERDI